ncbi:unnamed protein product [Prorocentrum cordatum]|uniref:NAD(P)(+)--arginine ADP-ribosyltransferase n=1 Tax=Prorocentrum cordatum TaxID=2364126 RepID=A0ABN9QN56_9DINO|nr:unnamed protein product [Polarella glacialis]
MGTSTGRLPNQDDAEPLLDPPPAKISSSAGRPPAARGAGAPAAALAAGSGQRPAAGPQQPRRPVEANAAGQLGSAFQPPPRSSGRGGEAARATEAPVGKPDAPQAAARTSTTDLTAGGLASRKPAGAGARAPRPSQSSGQPKVLDLRSPASARPAGTHSPRPSQPSSGPSASSQPSPKAAARLSSNRGAMAAAAARLPQPANGARAKGPLSPESEAKAESIHQKCAHDEDEWYIRVDDPDPQEAELVRAASAAGRGIEDICLLQSAADLCTFLHSIQVPETSLVLVDTACQCYGAWAFSKDFADKGGGNLFPVKVAITTDCEAALGEGSQSMPPSRSPTSPSGPSQQSATASQVVQRTVDHERIPHKVRVLQDRVPPGGAERGAVQPLDAESLRVVYEDSLSTASGEREGLDDELQAPAADRAALAAPSGPEVAQAGSPRRSAPSVDAERFRDIVERAAGEERRMGTDGRPHGRGSFVGSWETADAECPDWNLEAWLGSTAAVDAVAMALVPQELSCPGGSLAFITAVGWNGKEDREATRRAIAHQLRQNGISLKLANAIVDRGVALVDSAAATGEALNEKFAADGGFEFDFGTKADFFQGLEFRIGPPNSDVIKGMVYDHCENVDSKSEWTTGNYGITTTSRNEFLLVLQDVFDQLKDTCSLGATNEEVDEWGQQFEKLKEEVEKLEEPVHLGVDPPLQWPDETKNTGNPRSTKRAEILRGLAKKNEELRKLGEKPLLLAEAVALCLYSGPLFEKYNAVCRGGPLQCEPEPSKMRDRFQSLCGGPPGSSKEVAVNRYATTIHVLVSALVKASKTSKACTVMRGTTGGRLPKQFWEKDDAGVKGGIEYGFMSTTTDREVAMQYASGQSAGTVLEIQTGMIDRGAELSWISQYPHEKEMCFPPLTSMQVLGTSVKDKVLVVSLRLNLNLTCSTIEEVIGKRRKVVKDMCRNLQDEAKREMKRDAAKEARLQLKDEHVAKIQEVLEMALRDIYDRQFEVFNTDEYFQSSLKVALECKRVALQATGLAASRSEANRRCMELISHAKSRIDCDSRCEAEAVVGLLLRLTQIPDQQVRSNVFAAIAFGRTLEELIALAKAGGGLGVLTDWLRRAKNIGEVVREEFAVLALAFFGGPKALGTAIEPLVNLAQDKEPRMAACEALGAVAEAGGPEVAGKALEPLSQLAQDQDGSVREAACGPLGAVAEAGGPEVAGKALELLSRLAQDQDRSVRCAACGPLGAVAEAGGPEVAGKALEPLSQLAQDQDGSVREAACGPLGAVAEAGGPEVAGKALEPLSQLAQDKYGFVRAAACGPLGAVAEAGGPEVAGKALEPLLRLAQDQDWWVRQAACGPLGAVAEAGGPEVAGKALEPLSQLAQDHEGSVRRAACGPLGAVAEAGGPEVAGKALELLSRLAQDQDWSVREAACGPLGAVAEAGGPEVAGKALEPLSQLAQDQDGSVRRAACGPLGAVAEAGGPEVAGKALELLSRLAQDKDGDVRAEARFVNG